MSNTNITDYDSGTGADSDTDDIRATLLDYLDNSYTLPDVKNFEIQNERTRNLQALYRNGEYAIFVLMWTLLDYEAGLVGRCQTCLDSTSTLIQDAFKQGSYYKCPDCFGSYYEGGYKAILVRPSLWQWTEPTINVDKRGENNTDVATVQTTADFRLQPKDYIIRGDGVRWQVKGVEGEHLSTGFGTQAGPWNAISFSYSNVVRQDESSPIYLLPIPEGVIQSQIPQFYSRDPQGVVNQMRIQDVNNRIILTPENPS